MKPNRIITLLLLMLSLSVFAQSNYYYYKGQRIPLTVNPKKVNVISMTNGPQYAPSVQPSSLPSGLEVESVISDNPYNMCIIKNNTNNPNLLNNYVNSTINPNYNIIIPCYYNYKGEELITTNKIYVKLKKKNQTDILLSITSIYQLDTIRHNPHKPEWYTISITNQTPYKTVEMANILYETGAFAAVQPEFGFKLKLNSISWDENVSQQWGLYNATNDTIDINVSSAWNYATGKGVKIGIFDDGVYKDHIDLIDNMSGLYYDAMSRLSLWDIYGDHGTHVAGIAAAGRNNGIFSAGVAPDAKIIAASMNYGYFIYQEQISLAFYWLNKAGADIINCSWSYFGEHTEQIEETIDDLIINGRNGKGSLIVFSSGNSNSNQVDYPGRYRPEIITVGAIDNSGLRFYEEEIHIISESRTDTIIWGSNYGKNLDVVAPGINILSTVPNNNIAYFSGTSMAAPHVAGIAALILELNPDLTGQQVRDIIEQSTIKVGNVEYTDTVGRPNGTWNQYYGYGLVDALKAVQNTPRKQIEY